MIRQTKIIKILNVKKKPFMYLFVLCVYDYYIRRSIILYNKKLDWFIDREKCFVGAICKRQSDKTSK